MIKTFSFIIDNVIKLCILILPLSIIAFDDSGGIVFISLYLLSILGIIVKIDKISFRLCKSEKKYVFSFIFYFVIVCASVLFHDSPLRELDTPSRFILALPLFFYIRQANIDPKTFENSFILGGMACFMVVLFHIYGSDTTSNKLILSQIGKLGLFTSVYSLILAIFFTIEENNKKRLVIFIALILALFAMYWSASRGAWIAALMSVFFLLFLNNYRYTFKEIIKFLLTLLTIIVLVFSIGDKAKIRLQNTILGVQYILNPEINANKEIIEKYRNDSLSLRYEIWKAAIISIRENYVFGYGEGNFNEGVMKLIKESKSPKTISHIKNPHSEILSSFFEQGVFGLLSLIFVFWFPLEFALKSRREDNLKNKIKLISIPVIIVLVFFFYSIFNGVFDHQSSALFYATFISLSLGFIIKSKSS